MLGISTYTSTTKLNRVVQIAAVAVLALVWVFIPGVYTFFVSVLVVWAAFRLDSRMVAGSALLLLVMIPVLLATDHQDQAELFAVYVFFLLSITVVLQILELMLDSSPVAAPAPLRRVIQDMVQVRVLPNPEHMHARMDGITPRKRARA